MRSILSDSKRKGAHSGGVGIRYSHGKPTHTCMGTLEFSVLSMKR
jgi:hypothetical protein